MIANPECPGVEDFFMQPLKLHLIATREGAIRHVNGVWHQILGYSEKELEGTSVLDFIHPDDREATLRAMEKLARGETVVDFENRYRHRDGTYRTLSWSATEKPEAGLIYAAASDVTHSKELEAAVAGAERQFRDVLANVDLVSATLDASGNITFANDCLLRLTGWRLDEIVGRNWFDVFIPPGAPVRGALLRDVPDGGVPASFENEILTRDGGRRLISWSNVLLRDARGEPSGVAGIGVDVTEKRRTEAALAESEKKYRVLFENSPDACFIVADDVILDCNRRAEALLRGPKRDIVGKTLIDFSPEFQPDGRPSAEAARALTLQALRRLSETCGEPPDAAAADAAENLSYRDGHMVFEWVHRRLDGGEFPADVRAVPVVLDGRVVLFNTWRDITERKRTEETLRASEKKFFQTFMASPMLMVITRPSDGRIIEMNPAMETVLGFSREEAIGSTTVGLEVWQDEGDRERFIAELSRQGRVEPMDVRLRRKDGAVITALLSACMFDLDGEPMILSSVNDITERKRMERALRASEVKFSQAFMASPLAMLLTRAGDAAIMEVNPAFERVLGISREEAVGATTVGLGLWADPADHERLYRALLERGSVEQMELRLRKKNGESLIGLLSARLFDLDGEPVLLGSINDITERKADEERLRETNSYLENLFNYANAPIIVWDTQFRITRFNRAFEQLSGRTEADVLGQPLEILFPPVSAGASMELIRRTSGGERWEVVEIVIRHTDGSDSTVLWNSATIFTSDGLTPVSTIAQGQDITLRKQRETELAIAKEAAESANRAKSDFLANMSHEIRTPMNGVIGMTYLLLDTALDPDQRSYAETVRSSAESLLNILNDILDYSKIEAGKLELENVPFDLTDLLDDISSLLAPRAREKGIAFESSLVPGVPARLRGDPGRLRQILLNLASNALKFTHRGKVSITATMLDATDGSVRLLFSVADTGIGIPADAQARLFEKFTQADTSTTRRYGGTGLGLAISKDLAGRMGGEIGVTSEVGRGSEFWFTVRLGRDGDEQESSAPKPPDAMTSIASLYRGTGRVLLAEDNPASADAASVILRKMGLQVDVATNGADALRYLTTTSCDFVLMDLQMPEMDGFDVTRRLRASAPGSLNREVPIVAMTARAMPDDRQQCLAAGMNDHLRKPMSPADLARALHRWLPEKGSPNPAARPPASGLPVLVVEDDPINRRLAVKTVESLGFRVQAVTNGAEAVAAFAPGRFAAIIMDIAMPVMDGIAATVEIRRIEAGAGRTPIIALTANALPEDSDRCLAAGMDDFLAKPFRKSDLAAILQTTTS
jgi:PAS domain S-box-containing protein